MTSSVPIYAHMAAFLSYAAFAVIIGFRSSRSWLTTCYLLAAALTAAWSGSSVLAELNLLPTWVDDVLAGLRDASWYAILLTFLYFIGQGRAQWLLTAAIATIIIAANTAFSAAHLDAGFVLGLRIDSRLIGIVELCLGLFLLENMMRNSDRDQFWSAKHFGIGIGAVLLFQALVLLPDLLTNSVPAGMTVARPLVYVLVMPLFVVSALRSPDLELRVHCSRKIVLRTTALIATGVVLQGAAIAAFYLRTRGGDNGTVLAILVAFGTIIGVAVALASRTLRSRVGRFINENFFSYKYDYRLEWQNFILALTKWQDDDVPLGVLRTLAELLDSPGGALWVWRETWNRFMPAARWSFNGELPRIAPSDPGIQTIKDGNRMFLDLTLPAEGGGAAPWRQKFPDAWLLVPFRYGESLAGFALINRPRSEWKLDWEDRNLISLLSLQLAAYLVQHGTAQALADARQLEQFNKRFAFILHDTKNAIGQLTLLVRNAEQHGHEEEFRKDMVETLRNSVEKLQGLLASLTGSAAPRISEVDTGDWVDVSRLAATFTQERGRLALNLVNECATAAVAYIRDRKAFLGVLEHVVTNALEATADGSPVTLRVTRAEGVVRLSVEDKGPGMSELFIANELFRPRKTTKKAGFGIGAYQAREIMRDLGGEIEIHSRVGEGTTVFLLLPELVSDREAVGA